MNALNEHAGAIDGLLCGEASAAGVLTVRQVSVALRLNEDQAAQVLEAYAQRLAPDRLLYASVEELDTCGSGDSPGLRIRVHQGLKHENDRLYGVLRLDVTATDAQLPVFLASAGVNALLDSTLTKRASADSSAVAGRSGKALLSGATDRDAPSSKDHVGPLRSGQAVLRALLTDNQMETALSSNPLVSSDKAIAGRDASSAEEHLTTQGPDTKRLRSTADVVGAALDPTMLPTMTTHDIKRDETPAMPIDVHCLGAETASQVQRSPTVVRPMESSPAPREATSLPNAMSVTAATRKHLCTYPATAAMADLSNQAYPESGDGALLATPGQRAQRHPVDPDVRSSAPRRHVVLTDDEESLDVYASEGDTCTPGASLAKSEPDVAGQSARTRRDPAPSCSPEARAAGSEMHRSPSDDKVVARPGIDQIDAKKDSETIDVARTLRPMNRNTRACVAGGKVLEEQVTANGEIHVRLVDTPRYHQNSMNAGLDDVRNLRSIESVNVVANNVTEHGLEKDLSSTRQPTAPGTQPMSWERATTRSTEKALPIAQAGIRKFFMPRP